MKCHCWLLVSLTGLIFSCKTLDYKQKYFSNHIDKFGTKYALKVGPAMKDSSLPKNYKVPGIREIKIELKIIEKFWALFPDSTIIVESSVLYPSENGMGRLVSIQGIKIVDSFYHRAAKIQFIKRNHLLTKNKHILPVRK